VHIHHSVTGEDVDTQSVADAIELSESKYCSVGAMIKQSGAEISTTYSVQSLKEAEVGSIAMIAS
jgi:putative redox protein